MVRLGVSRICKIIDEMAEFALVTKNVHCKIKGWCATLKDFSSQTLSEVDGVRDHTIQAEEKIGHHHHT